MAAEQTPPAPYSLAKTAAARAWLQRQPPALRAAVEGALYALAGAPRPGQSRAAHASLPGRDLREVRLETPLGKCVVLYDVVEAEKRVTVVGIETVYAD